MVEISRDQRRAPRRKLVVLASVAVACTVLPIAASASQPAVVSPVGVVDVTAFSERADRWSEARYRTLDKSIAHAEMLVAEVRATTSEPEQAEEAATPAPTTAAPTTAAPTTTASSSPAPPTTVAPATAAPNTAAPATAAPATAAPTTAARSEPPATSSPPPATTEPAVTTTVASGVPSVPAGTTKEQWRALRECESKQDYSAVSRTGRYRGAYQFSVETWNGLARRQYPELVGVDPAQAAPADQDKMAYRLYESRGRNPWPHCGKVLPS